MQSVTSLRRRLLHWVFRIEDLKSTLQLLETQLGLKVQRHQEFELKCDASCNGDFQNPWSKTMVALGDEKKYFALQLVYNYGIDKYEASDSHFQALEFLDMNYDGYTSFQMGPYTFIKFGPSYFKNYANLIEGFKPELHSTDFKFVSFNVANLEKSMDYYMNVLNFQVFGLYNAQEVQEDVNQEFISNNQKNFAIVGIGQNQTLLKLVESDKPVVQGDTSGRMAFTIEKSVDSIKAAVESSGDTVLHQPVVLKTEGKADVIVIILKDRDGYEICFVEETGFHDLCTAKPGDDNIDWEKRKAEMAKYQAMSQAFKK